MLSATLALGFNFNAPLPAQSRAVRASVLGALTTKRLVRANRASGDYGFAAHSLFNTMSFGVYGLVAGVPAVTASAAPAFMPPPGM